MVTTVLAWCRPRAPSRFYGEPMAEWGDVGTWIGGVGTSVAVGVSLWQVRSERQARLARETEEAAARRRAHAVGVSAWHSGEADPEAFGEAPRTILEIENRSGALVFQVVITLVFSQGAAPSTGEEVGAGWEWRSILDAIPQGRWRVEVPGGWRGMHRHPRVEVAFTDLNGLFWIRRSDGLLEEIDKPAPDHYEIPGPFSFSPLVRVE